MKSIITHEAADLIKKINFKQLNHKSILITGASGIVGTYLTATLGQLVKKKNYDIRYYAVMQHDLPDYLVKIFSFNGIEIIKGDITNSNFLRKLPTADFIIHAAGYGQPGMFMKNPVKTLQINTTATFQLLEKLNTGGKFLFISTSEVYNGLTHPPFKESQIGTSNTTDARSCYIEGKRAGEAICVAFRQQGVHANSARLSLAYGPGTKTNDARVLNSFIQKALIQKEIKLLDQGEAKRTYCYITDAVELLWQILLFGKDDIYNVGGNSRTTIADLAKLIGKLIKVPVYFPDKSKSLQGAPADVYLDMTKSKKEFGKKKFLSLKQGLLNTIEYQRKIYHE